MSDLQNDICEILTRYGVKNIYECETEIISVLRMHGSPDEITDKPNCPEAAKALGAIYQIEDFLVSMINKIMDSPTAYLRSQARTQIRTIKTALQNQGAGVPDAQWKEHWKSITKNLATPCNDDFIKGFHAAIDMIAASPTPNAREQ